MTLLLDNITMRAMESQPECVKPSPIPSHLKLLAEMRRRADADGRVAFSQADARNILGFSHKSLWVRTVFDQLESAGFIERESLGGPGRKSVYIVK